MQKRDLGLKVEAETKEKEFIKDIFFALDEDGSGTMELDELIKGLLSLSLSQDIDFAKQIIYLFEETKEVKEAKKDHRHRLYKESTKNTHQDHGQELCYTFKDFLSIFKTDAIG